MRSSLFGGIGLLVLSFPCFAAPDDHLRLANPPAFRMTCLPGAQSMALEPVRVGQVPVDAKQQQAFLKQASRQNIQIGITKVGPFDEDTGELQATCKLGTDVITALFRYNNYPTTIAPDSKYPLMSEGQCDVLTHLELTSLTLNGKPWAEKESKTWSGFLHSCRGEEIARLTFFPADNRIEVCSLSSGGGLGVKLEAAPADEAEVRQTVTCEMVTPVTKE